VSVEWNLKLTEVNRRNFICDKTPARPTNETGPLRYGQMFAVFDRVGDIDWEGWEKVPILRRHPLSLGIALYIGKEPRFLLILPYGRQSPLQRRTLTNGRRPPTTTVLIPRGTVELTRLQELAARSCSRCNAPSQATAYRLFPFRSPSFSFRFAESLRSTRERSESGDGQHLPPALKPDGVVLSYRGLE